MLPAFSFTNAVLVNGRTLAADYRPADNLAVSFMVGPTGDMIWRHVSYRTDSGRWESLIF